MNISILTELKKSLKMFGIGRNRQVSAEVKNSICRYVIW